MAQKCFWAHEGRLPQDLGSKSEPRPKEGAQEEIILPYSEESSSTAPCTAGCSSSHFGSTALVAGWGEQYNWALHFLFWFSVLTEGTGSFYQGALLWVQQCWHACTCTVRVQYAMAIMFFTLLKGTKSISPSSSHFISANINALAFYPAENPMQYPSFNCWISKLPTS